MLPARETRVQCRARHCTKTFANTQNMWKHVRIEREKESELPEDRRYHVHVEIEKAGGCRPRGVLHEVPNVDVTIANLELNIQRLESPLEETLNTASVNSEDVQSAPQQSYSDFSDLTGQYERIKSEKERLEVELQDLQEKLERIEQERIVERKQKEEQNQMLKQLGESYLKKLEEATIKLKEEYVKSTSTESELATLKRDLVERQESIKKLESTIVSKTKEIEALQKQLQEVKSTNRIAKDSDDDTITKLKKELESVKQEKTVIEQELKSKVEMMEGLHEKSKSSNKRTKVMYDSDSSCADEATLIEIDSYDDDFQSQSPVVTKRCSRCKCLAGTRLKKGGVVEFDIKLKTGKLYSECRRCRDHTNNSNSKATETHRRIMKEADEMDDPKLADAHRMTSLKYANNQKVIQDAEESKEGFILYIASSQNGTYPHDTYSNLKVRYAEILGDYDSPGPLCDLSGIPTVLRKPVDEYGNGAGFKWVAQRWDNSIGHCHPAQELAHFNQFSNRFCNDRPKEVIYGLLNYIAKNIDWDIAIPSTWTPDQPIPAFPYPVTVNHHDPDFLAYKRWVDNRLGYQDANGVWIGHWSMNEKTRGNRPITVTKEYMNDLYWANGGSWCRVFGVKGCWEKGSPRLLSIDKIDCTKGYEPGNLMIVLDRANDARCRFPWSDYLLWRGAAVSNAKKLKLVAN